MSEEQIIALTEIGGLQRQNLENYKLARQKQQEAIDLQKQSVAESQKKYAARQKMIVMMVTVFIVVALLIVTPSSMVTKGGNHKRNQPVGVDISRPPMPVV